MEIKLNVNDARINHEELQKIYSDITAMLLSKGIVGNIPISKNFQPVFIISTGRTGTKFISTFFNKFQFVISKHEPQPDFLNLANSFIRRETEKESAIKEFTANRAFLIGQANMFKMNNYIESNNRLFALIPVIKDALPIKKFIHIVRDGRDVVRSGMNRGYYSQKDPFDRISALDFPNDPYFENWHEMTLFEKTCWWWQKKDSIIYNDLKDEPNSLRLKFEDLMDKKHYGPNVRKLCQFVGIPSSNKVLKIWDNMLQTPINKNPFNDFPKWKDWTEEQKGQFEKIAGDHMKEIGYNYQW